MLNLLSECSVSLPKLEKAFAEYDKESKAEIVNSDQLKTVLINLGNELSYIHERITYLRQEFANHLKNHIPNPRSVEQLQRAIEKLGLDKEFEVKKTVIYSSSNGGMVAEVQ